VCGEARKQAARCGRKSFFCGKESSNFISLVCGKKQSLLLLCLLSTIECLLLVFACLAGDEYFMHYVVVNVAVVGRKKGNIKEAQNYRFFLPHTFHSTRGSRRFSLHFLFLDASQAKQENETRELIHVKVPQAV